LKLHGIPWAGSAIAAAMIVAAASAPHSSPGAAECPDRRPRTLATKTEIPGFPRKQSDLLKWKRAGAEAEPEIREHAWNLFAGMVLNKDKYPLWNDWYTKCDLHISDLPCPDSQPGHGGQLMPQLSAKQTLLANLKVPSQLLTDQATPSNLFSASGELAESDQVAEVTFNPEAARHIQSIVPTGRPDGNAALAKILTSSSRNGYRNAAVSEFPLNAIVVKTIWELVTGPDLVSPPEVSVWDPAMKQQSGLIPDQLDAVQNWKTKISVDTTPGVPCDATRDYPRAESVPLSCFFSVCIEARDIQSVLAYSGLKLVAGPGGGNPPYHLVLIGFHVMTREIKGWTWQTFYWSAGAFGEDRLKRYGNPAVRAGDLRWSHYVMDATLSQDLPLEADGGRKICFDPYLEGPFEHGEVSNCLTCHQYAYYHVKFDNSGYGYALHAKRDKPATRSETAAYRHEGLQTSFLWSLADVNKVAPGTPRNAPGLSDILEKLEEKRLLLDQKGPK
jgi:hypothetical protein